MNRNFEIPGRRSGCFCYLARAPARALLGLGLMLLLWPPAAATLRAEANAFEKQNVEADAVRAFRAIMTLWQEELYFELYDHGNEATKARITKEEFADRMVRLSWVPQGKLNPEFLKPRFRFRTMVYITARVRYRHKFKPEAGFFKNQTFLLLQEEGRWRIDLIQIIRAPFA